MTQAEDDNRAVTPWFRAFSAPPRPPVADLHCRSARPAMHGGERAVLAGLVSLVLGSACWEGLTRLLPTAWAAVWWLPTLFLLVNTLPFLVPGRTPRAAWWWWAAVLGGWSWWVCGVSAPVRWVAWIWLIWLAMQVPALIVLGWRRLMRVQGTAGQRCRVGVLVLFHVAVLLAGWWGGWLVGCGCLMVLHALWLAGTLRPGAEWFGPVRRVHADPSVWITIDDGPDPGETPVLLDLLDAAGARAVFFVIGEKVMLHPGLAREIVRRGHELGNHTLGHPAHAFWRLGPAATRREIEGCQQVLRRSCGVEPRWFRAPAGHRNFFTHPVAGALGLSLMAWSRRGYDTGSADAGTVLRRIARGLRPGDIVLIHEGTGRAAEVLRGVLEEIRRRGLRVRGRGEIPP